MKRFLKGLVIVAGMFAAFPAGAAEEGLVQRAAERERATFGPACGEMSFLPEAFIVGDVSKDGIDDVIINAGAVSCGGAIGSECNSFGCPFRIYVQAEDGKLNYISQVRALEMKQGYLYGIRNLKFRIKGKHCQKLGRNTCTIITRIENRELVTIATE
ncbi:MAG: hypothetical protein RLZZ444_3324 [Pseudomonadota bacterium]